MKKVQLFFLCTIIIFLFPALILGGAQAKPIKMIMTHEVAITHWKHPMMEKYGKLVEERSKGRILPEIYPAGQLYTDKNALSALGTGGVHMVWPITGGLEPLFPSFALFSYPFFIEDQIMIEKPQYVKDLTGLFSRVLAPKKIKLMGVLRNCDSIWVFRSKQPKSLEEMKGLKIRVPSGLVWLDILKAWGVTAISMPASEMAAAIAQGVIDGIRTSPPGWARMIGMAAPNCLILPDLYLGTYQALVDANWLSQLPKDIQDILQKTMDDLLKDEWEYSIKMDEIELDLMRKQGASFYKMPKKILKEKWVPLAQPSIDNFSKRFLPTYREAMELRKKYSGD